MSSQLKKGAFLSYFNIALSIVLGFALAPVLLHSMGSSEYGAYQMTAALIGYVSILDFGLHNSVSRYVAKYQAVKDEKGQANFIGVALILFAIIALAILIIVGILYLNIDNIYSASSTIEEIATIKRLIIILGINLTLSMPGAVFSSIITAYEHFAFGKLLTVIKLLLRFLSVYILSFWYLNALILALIDFILNISLIGLEIFYCFKTLKIKIKLTDCSLRYIKPIFTFSFYIFIAAISEQINWKVDTTIIGISIGTIGVTKYSIATNLIGYYRSFSGAISGIFLPKATKMVALKKSDSELTDLMIKVGRIQLMIVGLVLVGFIVLGKEFISLWMGTEFTDAYVWFLIMAVPLVIPMTQSIGINVLEAKNIHHVRACVYLFIAIGNVLLSIVLINAMGITGAAIGTSITMFVGNNLFINYYYSKRAGLEITRFFKEVFGSLSLPIILSLTLTFVTNAFLPVSSNWLIFMLKCFGIICCYAASLVLLGLNKQEKQIVRTIGKDKLWKI